MSSENTADLVDTFERVAYSFYSRGDSSHGKVLEWFVNPSQNANRLDDHLIKEVQKHLGNSFIEKVQGDESFYQLCIHAKNRARTKAHIDKGVERIFTLKEICIKSQERYGIEEDSVNRSIDSVKLMLGKLLSAFRRDESLIIIVRGIANYFDIQMTANSCLTVKLTADSLSERNESLQRVLCEFLCSVAVYVPDPSGCESDNTFLSWSTKPLLSNRTLNSLSRNIKECITNKGLDSKVKASDSSVISVETQECSVSRINVDGTKDLDSALCSAQNFNLYCCFSSILP